MGIRLSKAENNIYNVRRTLMIKRIKVIILFV